MTKVLVTDPLAPQGLEILRAAKGIDVVEAPDLSPGALLAAIADADALIIRSGTKVTADVIEAGKHLKVIGRAGIGVDNVDVAAATAHGVVVMNTPGGNTVTTAEHALALLISLARHIPQATASMKAGKWEKKRFIGVELFNRTLGVVGLGNIGRIVAQRARGLGMKVIAHDPFLSQSAADKLDVELVSFEALLERADAITVHVPRTKDTIGLLGAAAFAKMKPGVLVVNAARGGIVDEDALLEALESGRVGGAGLDVFVDEPVPPDHPLVKHERVVCTPHLGAATEQAQLNVAIAIAEQVRDFLLHGVVHNAVNMPSISKELAARIRPYLVLGEKLGRFHGQLCTGSIESVEIEYSGDAAALPTEPITTAVLKGLLESVCDEVNMVNAPVLAKEHGIHVVESKTSRSADFTSAIATRVTGAENRLIVGAVFHGGQPRIVRIDDFMLEAIPEGPTLFIRNRDHPGVVGGVGTVLGEEGINISRMQLALHLERAEAAMLVNVDQTPSDRVLRRLEDHPHIISARLVELGS
ncbi:MAG: phosphoglycerate dehydrogenase [Myxococcales bacterium]|nr:phosphoglycerate dehydrogenase [Myxococcales bacterium]MDH5567094.1 phosphoglycerate dehydrogenase [Myxococcales bacterium]